MTTAVSDDVLIRVEGVSKRFCHDLKRSLWYGVQDTLGDCFGLEGGDSRLRRDEFWAVDCVSFELKRGKCLGLIGRNGAGKTTLLKMLNGLIKPDKGRIETRGRVGALIALGAGFNPILTGRENIYINGSVLGLSKRELDAKVDDIIEFTEIGKFIDAPVQSYSSGMSVRLGFAVATAMEPDVLLLDEVLAVGDASFQAKCFLRIEQVLNTAAVILVSHYSYHIRRVCNDVLLLESGRSAFLGRTDVGLVKYDDMASDAAAISPTAILGEAAISVEVVELSQTVPHGSRLQATIDIILSSETLCDQAYIHIKDHSDFSHALVDLNNLIGGLRQGRNRVTLWIGPLFLAHGLYQASLTLSADQGKTTIAEIRNCFAFRSVGPSRLGTACYYPTATVSVDQVAES